MLSKLVTRHDRYHVHKVLGVGCLLSFTYSYAVRWPQRGDLGATWAAIWMHFILSASSIQFKVPAKRIARWPTMIWEEYRLHAIVFSSRALVVAAFTGAPRVAGIAAVHVAADLVTRHWGTPGNTTVRGDHARVKSFRVQQMTRAYATYQHLAIASHLVCANSLDIAYNAYIAVQSSAFCMTLHRKGIITHKTHAIVYTICIIASGLFIMQSMAWWQFVLALLFGYARTQGTNKYPLWLLYWAVCTIAEGYLRE